MKVALQKPGILSPAESGASLFIKTMEDQFACSATVELVNAKATL
jgi:hypothetical protein